MPGKVENTATVKVGNNPEVTTNTLKNPVPKKDWKEGSDGDNGNTVGVGSHINYEIFYGNNSGKTATVKITDKLDANVKFVSATNGGTYDKVTHTVTWTIPNVPTGTFNKKVTLEVQVRNGAEKAKEITNTAIVQVGNGLAKETNTVKNPVTSDTSAQISSPTSPTSPTNPTTGDMSNVTTWLGLFVLAALLFVGISVYRRRTRG